MKNSLFNTVGAIAFASVAFTFSPSTLRADDGSVGLNAESTSKKVIEKEVVDEQVVKHRAKKVIKKEVVEEQPAVEEVVEQPAVEEQVVEQPGVEEEQAEVVTYLPKKCTTVYVKGVRCWYTNGFYYRHCLHGYRKFYYRTSALCSRRIHRCYTVHSSRCYVTR